MSARPLPGVWGQPQDSGRTGHLLALTAGDTLASPGLRGSLLRMCGPALCWPMVFRARWQLSEPARVSGPLGDGVTQPGDGPSPTLRAGVPAPASSLPVLEGGAWELDCRIVEDTARLTCARISCTDTQAPGASVSSSGKWAHAHWECVAGTWRRGAPGSCRLLISVLSRRGPSSLPAGA